MELHLSPRLRAAADLIGPSGGVADVGTDHGYLPVFLALRQRAGRLVAADLREGPLSRARETARQWNVTERLEFVLSDGLEKVTPEGLSWVVICGMGGETIRGILERAPWTRERDVTLVLQPQSKQEELTAWLGQNGWRLAETGIARDAGRIYPLFSVRQAWEPVRWGEAEIYRDLARKREPLLREYLDQRLGTLQDALRGMHMGGEAAAARIRAVEQTAEELGSVRKETEAW